MVATRRPVRSPAGAPAIAAGAFAVGVFSIGAVLSFACSSPPEDALLDRFFRAVAQEDTTTMLGASMVAFPGGPVTSWEIVERRGEVSGPYRLAELRAEESASEQRRDEQFQALYAFQQANRDEIEAIRARRDRNPDASIGGRLGEIAAEWDAFGSERRAIVSSLSEVQMAIESERRRTRRSLLREAPVDYLTGVVREQELVLRIEEEAGVRDYRFSLLRYDLTNQFDAEVPSRWVIAAIEPLDADRDPPAGGEEPPAGGDDPPAGGEGPPAGGEDQPAGGEEPSAAAKD